MRLERLGLDAFGSFTDRTLTFGGDPGLHLVFGPNEAGKSTALRAIHALLFGIPARSGDAHLHPRDRLRISGLVSAQELGLAPLDLVRVRGKKNSLKNPENEPVALSELEQRLSGVSAELFERLFGLDHHTLRQGAAELLAGRGDAGTALFQAGLGRRGIVQLLRSLEDQADAIFTPRSRKKSLDEAIGAFRQADLDSRNRGVSAEAFEEQKRRIRDLEQAKSTHDARRKALLAERFSLERQRVLVPIAVEWKRLSSEVGSAGDLGQEAARAAELAEETERSRQQFARDLGLAAREIERLQARLGEFGVEEAFVGVPSDVIEDLALRRGSHIKATTDLPQRRAAYASLINEAEEQLRRVDPRLTIESAEAARVTTSQAAELRRLSQAQVSLLARKRSVSADLNSAASKLDSVTKQLESRADPVHLTTLASGLRAAHRNLERLGDVAMKVAELKDQVETAAERVSGLAGRLGLSEVQKSPLAGLPVVPRMAVAREFESEANALSVQAAGTQEQLDGCRTRLDEIELRLARLSAGEDVPSEEGLKAARSERDRLWHVVRRGLGNGAQTDAGELGLSAINPEHLSDAIASADQVADRLRREAARVEEHRALREEHTQHKKRLNELHAQASDEKSAREDLATAWRGACSFTGERSFTGEPLSPPKMVRWLDEFSELSREAERHSGHAKDLARIQNEVASRCDDLRKALVPFSAPELASLQLPPAPQQGAPAGVVLAFASQLLESLDGERIRRETLSELNKESRERIRELTAALEELEREERDWRRKFSGAAVALGLDGTASPEEALGLVDGLGEVYQNLEKAKALKRRIEGMERDERELESLVQAVGHKYALEPVGETLAQRVHDLVARHKTATAAHERVQAIQEELTERRRGEARTRQDLQQAEGDLAALLESAGVQDLAALLRRGAKAADLLRTKERLRELELQLAQLSDGQSIADTVRSVAEVDLTNVRVRLSEVEEETEEATEELSRVNQDLGGTRDGLLGQQARTLALSKAAEAESHLSRVRELGHRYTELKLAAVVLRRQIDSYRRAHQGPLLKEANRFFPQLTLGAYQRLTVNLNDSDAEILLCVREDGVEVPVEGLSEGTRDQLYLSLRLATWTHYLSCNPPMPVVLDDVLVHFDDERSAAALGLLSELAQRTQVFLFTHHRHLLGLARRAAPEGLTIHELSPCKDEPKEEAGPEAVLQT